MGKMFRFGRYHTVMNLCDLGNMMLLDTAELKDGEIRFLSDYFNEDYEGLSEICIPEHIFEWTRLSNSAIINDSYYIDNEYAIEEAEKELRYWLKDSPYYLVFASNCTWNHASAYKFVDNILETIERSYNVSIYPYGATERGKVLVCKEYSHDVPMGSFTYIIALTDRQYETLQNMGFSGVQKYVEKCVGDYEYDEE